MKAETPAEGILKRNEWGDSVLYQVTCSCGDAGHDHNVWIEIDPDMKEVMVTTYTMQKSKWWEQTRWRTIWHLLTRGHVEFEATIIMSPQQALNYAETLKTAVNGLGTKK
jgi:hypothetical protein